MNSTNWQVASRGLPLVLPLMMPTRHLMEKENIRFFPLAGRPPFLGGSVWGRMKERCLGGRRPFPNTTLADMFILGAAMRKQPSPSPFPPRHPRHSSRPRRLSLAPVFTCSPPPTLENIQSSQVYLSKIHRKQVQVVVVIVFLRRPLERKSRKKYNKIQTQFLEDWWGKSWLEENVFLHLWHGQF